MRKSVPVLATVLLTALVLAAGAARAAVDIPAGVKTLVQQKCIRCHEGPFAPKGLNLKPGKLAAVLDAPSKEFPEAKLIDTKAPEASYLLKKVRRESGIKGKGMPPDKALTAEELKVIEDWILGLK
jgi:hypothetical protein